MCYKSFQTFCCCSALRLVFAWSANAAALPRVVRVPLGRNGSISSRRDPRVSQNNELLGQSWFHLHQPLTQPGVTLSEACKPPRPHAGHPSGGGGCSSPPIAPQGWQLPALHGPPSLPRRRWKSCASARSVPDEHRRAPAPAAGARGVPSVGGKRAQSPLNARRDRGNCSLASDLQNPEKGFKKMSAVQCPDPG